MTRRFLRILGLAAGLSTGLLQRPLLAQEGVQQPRRFDRVILLLDKDETSPQFNRSSSGFVVKADKDLFIVTAKHRATYYSARCELGIPLDDTHATWVLLAEIANSQDGKVWQQHPTADVSLARIDPDKKPDVTSQLERIAIPSSSLIEGQLEPGASVDVVGVPVVLGFQTSGPINRLLQRTTVATREIAVPPVWNMATMFLVASALSEGVSSGAPVFKNDDDPLAANLLGISSGPLPDRTGPKYGIITPAHYLKDLIQTPAKSGAD